MPHLDTPLERKLTAILHADVAGYSRLTEEDEAGTHRLLSESLDHIAGEVGRYNGKVEHYAGDAILAEFPSVIQAVACALTTQAELHRNQSHLPEEHRVKIRMAINLGEVIVDRGEIYGEGVNIEAYDLFLQGWAHYQRETPGGYADAIPFLIGAVELDPAFNRPHAVLAAIYYQGRLRRWNRDWGLSDHEAFRLAYEHLKSAKTDPTALGLSTSALMHIHNGRHALAIGEAQEAIALDSNDPTAQIVLAYALSTAGESNSAIEHATQAMRLNPHYPASYVWTLGLAHFVNADYGRARKLFEEAGTDQAGLDLVPLLATYGFLGRGEEAGKLFGLQLARWRDWHPGYPMTVRSLVAEFPPFLKKADRDRVSDGLEKAIAHRLSSRSRPSTIGSAATLQRRML